MYLSIIQPDRTLLVKHFLAQHNINVENEHRMIASFFNHQNRFEGQILYRKDHDKIYIQSAEKPDKNKVAEFGYRVVGERNIDDMFNSIVDGQSFRIVVRLSAVKKTREGKYYTPNEAGRLDFVKAKLKNVGFDVELEEFTQIAFITEDAPKVLHVTHELGQDNQGDFKFIADDYHCMGTVINAKKFIEGMKNGIGKYKAYGCGLILIEKAF